MTGETEKDISGWTVDTVRAHFEGRFDDLDAQIQLLINANNHRLDLIQQHFEARIDNFEKRLTERASAQQEAIEQVRRETAQQLAAADKAILKAEASNDKKFESVNEFRGQLADQNKTFITRELVDSQIAEIKASVYEIKGSIDGLRSRLDSGEGTTRGQKYGSDQERADRAEDRARTMMIFAGVSFLVTVVTLANLFLGR